MDGVDLGAVQVTVVLAVLQEAAALDVRLHLAARHEQVHLSLLLVHFGLTGRVYGAGLCISSHTAQQEGEGRWIGERLLDCTRILQGVVVP